MKNKTKKTTKTAKTTKPKQTKEKDPFEFGMDTEQVLANTLCDKFLKSEGDVIDDAFIGAFNALTHRMLTIFKKEFVFELVGDMVRIVEEENTEEHICNDCREEKENGTITDEARNKMH